MRSPAGHGDRVGHEATIRRRGKLQIPDVLGLSRGDGIKLVRDVRAQYPQLPILVLSMHDEAIYAERMLSRRSQWLPKEAGHG